MKQIYYTQCPIGYGLGASNGFQIKRLTPGYPISGDFRYLGLRAFLAGTRTMAPAALRYRRNEQGEAEVAWLCPRSHEYETERGLWGRPGGHFAHGLLLENGELATLGNWPAGLSECPLWIRSDRSPSRGEPPPPLELSAADLRLSPDFDAFANLVQSEDVDLLASLLASLATVVREGRTLYLIDTPDRLTDRIALLTLAFPTPWRAALTFSTYHDRPEELPGFRIQGSIPAARPNRPALLASGIVADLGSGLIEPRIEPAAWARSLARWLTRRDGADRQSWQQTERRGLIARSRCDDVAAIWTDEWLDQLYGFESLIPARTRSSIPPGEWADLTRLTRWAKRYELAEELVEARPPAWWREAAGPSNEAQLALREHLGLPSAWSDEDAPAAWGETLALWSRQLGTEPRLPLIEAALGLAPSSVRPRFVRALIGALPDPEALETLEWLERSPSSERALLLPLGVRGAVAEALERRDPRRIRNLLAQAFSLPEALPAVLDAMAVEASARPEAHEEMTGWLAQVLEPAGPRSISVVLRWALRQGDAAQTWLRTFLSRRFADPENQAAWHALQKMVPHSLQKSFATVVLEVGRDPTLPDEAFRWGVEEVLLHLPESDRPHAPTWAGTYLDRTPSGLDLLKRLFTTEYRKRGLARWVEKARARGELSDEHLERIVACEQYARVLKTGDARSLLEVKLPAVPVEERGALLGQILRHLGGGGPDALGLALDTCRDAWPEGFAAGRPGLTGLARVLAEPLVVERAEPAVWFDRLVAMLDRLGLTHEGSDGFEADSLAAGISAETMRRPGPPFNVWTARQFLLQNDRAWRLLAADVRRDLAGKSLPARLECLESWDRHLTKGLHTRRFFEVWLNVCDGPTLAVFVAARAADLKSLGPIPWWRSGQIVGSRNDLRDAFATLAPMAPLPETGLTSVQNWLRPNRPADFGTNLDGIERSERPALAVAGGTAGTPEPAFLSRTGSVRWRCLEALSALYRTGIGSGSCWQSQAGWENRLPLGDLDPTDRYRFVAWFIRRVDEFEVYQLARFAKWIFENGLSDHDRLAHWAEELHEIDPVAHATRLARASMVGELRVELRNVIRDARAPVRKS